VLLTTLPPKAEEYRFTGTRLLWTYQRSMGTTFYFRSIKSL